LNWIALLALFFAAFAGGLLVLIFKMKPGGNLKLLLSFSGAYLLGISVIHLLPEVFAHAKHSNIGVYVLAGFFVQILLEFISDGVEHGHASVSKSSHNHSVFPYMIMLSLCLHSILEGMPVGHDHDHHHGNEPLLTGILLHKIPEGIALTSTLLRNGVAKNRVFVLLIIFAMMTPLGGVLSLLLEHYSGFANTPGFFEKVMAFVIGIFLHISTTILFESSENHKFNLMKLISIMIGFGLAVLML
jgi:zinc and cadmium transporter